MSKNNKKSQLKKRLAVNMTSSGLSKLTVASDTETQLTVY